VASLFDDLGGGRNDLVSKRFDLAIQCSTARKHANRADSYMGTITAID
jgi:hypothetical protein